MTQTRVGRVVKQNIISSFAALGNDLQKFPEWSSSFNSPRPNQITSAYGWGPSLMLHPA